MRPARSRLPAAVLAALTIGLAAPLHAQGPTALDSTVLSAFRWRSIGPANMGGRVADIEGIPSPSRTFFVAAAGGGIWKTTNAGTTFRPVFEHERVVAMGDLAIAPSDTMQVWAGTGEQNSRNSISPGGGIYKSMDGGLTWKLMGLEKTQVIARIVVDPRNADVVYVAALGHIWDSNPERGLYKTTDGGRTWTLSKFVSDHAGFVDVAIDPKNPDVLYASSWERWRTPYSLQSGGPGSGLWKTTDAGAHWAEVKGGGFPAGTKGRIGLAIAPSDPNVVYALVEAAGAKEGAPNESGLYRSADAGATWTKMNAEDTRPFYYSQVRVDPRDPNRVYWSSTPVKFSNDGGKTMGNATVGIHVDHHAMWIDPNDPNHFIVGDDGGISQTWDRGGNYDFLNNFAIGQFYEVSYDMAVPYHVCGGLQDNGAWCGPSRRARGGITSDMWATVNGGDGFFTAQDQTDPNIVYAESQGGNMARLDMTTGERTRLRKPSFRDRYKTFEDSIVIERGDTAKPETPAQESRLATLRARQSADSADNDLRWNWNTPFFLSPHDQHVLYAGANKVLKSTKRGDDLVAISPDLTRADTMKIRVSTETTGGITRDVTGAETFATIVALAESPVRKGWLYAGTDDGNAWMTRDDGKHWEKLNGRFPGVPDGTWVRRIEPSHFDANTFYVAFDGHRTGDFTPYLYVTDDGGKSFRSIASDLPRGGPDFVHVVREDPFNRDLLFAGTDVGAYVSIDRGGHWQRFMEGLPTVPVHDLKIQPRDHELIAATHGRSIWIVGIAPLEQMGARTLAAATLFQPPTAFQYGETPIGGGSPGQKVFEGESAPYGAEISYYLPSGDRRQRAHIAVLDAKGDTVQTLTGPGAAGLHTVAWNYRKEPPPPAPLSPSEKRDSARLQVRIAFLTDSLEKAGTDAQLAGRVAALARRSLFGGPGAVPFGFGFGGRGRARPGVWVDRPGEQMQRSVAARGETAGAGEKAAPDSSGAQAGRPARAGRAAGASDMSEEAIAAFMRGPGGELFRDFLRLTRVPGIGGRFAGGRGGFFGGAPAPAPPGQYTISVSVGGQTLTGKLQVQRIGNLGAGEDEPISEEEFERH